MIRKRTDADTAAIIQVWHAASRMAHPFLSPEFVAKAQQDLAEIYIPQTETWVYEHRQAVIGFISMLGCEIGGLFVLPRSHNQGIGTQLVNHVRQFHPELQVEVFEQNAMARAFYQKLGFAQVESYLHTESAQQVLRMACRDFPQSSGT
jgi:putative acetyltransferase